MDRTGRFTTLAGGISVGSEKITAGTLSGIFIDLTDGREVLVSNLHVFEGEPGKTVILQPGRHPDGGRKPDDIVGILKRYVPLRETKPPLWRRIICHLFGWLLGDWCLSSPEPNLVDVACAEFWPYRHRGLVRGVYLDDGRILYPGKTHPGDGIDGARVWKSGRTTGVTIGTVLSDSVTLKVWYGDRFLVFGDQILVEGVSDHGDSGSPVFLMSGDSPSPGDALVGILFAGSGGFYVACKWKWVRELLKIEWLRE